jgi:prepilin-type N-terminal cleavage/methylation domain-containing protein
MMRNRPAFTLVELLVVMVVGAVVLGAAVQSLVLQERANRTTNEVIRGQDALRSALGIMEGELREVATMGGNPVIGVGDLVVATPDSLVVRAPRVLGFVCTPDAPGQRLVTWSLGLDRFDASGGILIFQDNITSTGTDDRWLAANVTSVETSSIACPPRPGTNPVAHQRVTIGTLEGGTNVNSQFLEGVHPGAPVRGFQRVTYGLYSFAGEWGLGRRVPGPDGDALNPLVVGLAGPGSGLVFTYLDSHGNPITADPIPVATVASVRVTARTQPRPGSGAAPVDLATRIYFRNN